MPKKQPISKQTPSITEEQLAMLRELMPQVFSEGKVDFDKLRAALGDFGDERPERYSFSWAGKRDAIRILQTPSRATLVPARKESVDFDKTQNLFIEGDNLEALKLLYKPYFGQVKMIYIDPPYNTGNDFVYPDNFADPLDTYLKLTGQKDSEGNLLTSNAETGGRYHSAWLSMMYPRLFLARQLLDEDGLIFISIDDKELHNLRLLMNEIFGEENFIANITWEKRYTRNNDAKLMASVIDYVMVYRKSEALIKIREARNEKSDSIYSNPDNDPRGVWTSVSYVSQRTKSQRPNLSYKIKNPFTGKFTEHPTSAWKYSKEQNELHAKENRLFWGADGSYQFPRLKRFLSELEDGLVLVNLWNYKETGTVDDGTKEVDALLGKDVFDYPKPASLLKRMMKIIQDEDAIVLDFFSGSATTAQAVLELNREDGGNRKFILVQLPEPTGNKEFPTIAEIGKERIRRVIKKMKKEREGQLKLDKPEDLGFKVFKLRESNYKQWDGNLTGLTEKKSDKKSSTEDLSGLYAKQMEMLADPLVKGWKEEDVIYEVALKEGYGLNITVEDLTGLTEKPSNRKGSGADLSGLYHVTDPDKEQGFYISLADKVKLKDVKPLELKKDGLFICRDIALDDETAANLSLQCRLKTI
ncbi:MAG: site-specific DNA-methyltransferase [Chloroflexi bacterium]|nr:site-specific DNA-methyltransferase [Chloroflexota bacterium]